MLEAVQSMTWIGVFIFELNFLNLNICCSYFTKLTTFHFLPHHFTENSLDKIVIDISTNVVNTF
jgi:hypothetical protein